MKLVIPETVQIGGHVYKIVFNRDVVDEGDYARVNHRTLTIELNPVRPASQKGEALIHELIHIVNSVYNNGRFNEDDVAGLSEGLWQVLNAWIEDIDFSNIKEVGGKG